MVGANISGRLLLRSTLPELSYAVAAQLPEELRDELRELPDVQTVHELNLVQAKVGGEAIVSWPARSTPSRDRGSGYRRGNPGTRSRAACYRAKPSSAPPGPATESGRRRLARPAYADAATGRSALRHRYGIYCWRNGRLH